MDRRFEHVSNQIVRQMEELKVPGVAVGILANGQEQVAGFGVTSVENPLEVNENTLFQIGSITKTFTATMAMRLVEQGSLDLDRPVRHYLPDLKLQDESVAARVTLRHLFTHVGGWEGDYFADFGFGDDAVSRYVASMAEVSQVLPLGQIFSYNNAGFSLAGRVIEVVTGQSFEAALSELIFQPLGMMNSFMHPTDVMTRRFAVGHATPSGQPTVNRPWQIPRSSGPAGAIVSSVSDMFRYARFHLGDGTTPDGARLLQPASVALMQTRQVAAICEDEWGIAWGLRTFGGERLVGHGGGTFGQISQFTIVPTRGFALVVLTNADRGGEVTSAVERVALEQYLGLVQPEVSHRDLAPEEVVTYAGRYGRALMDCEITPREGGLTLQVVLKGGFPTKDTPPPTAQPPPVRLAFYAPDRVIVLDPPFKDARADFLRDGSGRIGWFRMGRAAPLDEARTALADSEAALRSRLLARIAMELY